MAKFKAGDKVIILDTNRVRQGTKHTIGNKFTLDYDMVNDLNAGFPVENPEAYGGYTYLPEDLAVDCPSPYSSTPKQTQESDLDRMERVVNEQDKIYRNPNQEQYWPVPDVKSVREELKYGATSMSSSDPYRKPSDWGMDMILIPRSKKKRRRTILVESIPTLHMPNLRH